MKTKLFFLTICVAMLSMGATSKIKDDKTLRGNSMSDFGEYTIVVSDAPMVVDNQVLRTFDLTYERTVNPIRIGLVEDKNCTVFIVRTDDFEVGYVCKKGVFGVKKIEKKYQQVPNNKMEAKLNKVSYFSQRVICQDKKSEDELLGLIACYFPSLVNEEYQASF